MKIAIFGYGGHAREVGSLIEKRKLTDVTYFVDDSYSDEIALPISKFDPSIYKIMVAIGDPHERRKIVASLPIGTKFYTYIDESALIYDNNVYIGAGSFIGPGSILTTNIRIGEHAILNRGVHIGHDCRIGDYFSAMPGSIISGNVIIGDNFYIGTNSSVREKISICDNTKIGLNSGVVKNIIAPGTYAGSPAIIRNQYERDIHYTVSSI